MLRFSIHVIVLTLLVWTSANYSFFGIGERVDKYLQDVFNTHVGSLVYPDARDDITVLLLTDQAIDTYQAGHWPASYDFHGAVLKALLRHEPKAVFIDFLWLSHRTPATDGVPQEGTLLLQILRKYRSAGIPVFLAMSPGVKTNWGADLDDLVIPVSVPANFDAADFVARSYTAYDGGQRTAAFAIADRFLGRQFASAATAPIEVFWGTRPNSKNLWMHTPDARQDGVGTILTKGFGGTGTSLPFHTTLFVRDLLNQHAESDEQAKQEADALLSDKFVFYGAKLSGVNDLILTPTRDIVPGVYFHAMALDNLLTWGTEYKSEVGSYPGRIWANQHVLSMIVVLPIVIMLALFQTRRREEDQELWDRFSALPFSHWVEISPCKAWFLRCASLAAWVLPWLWIQFFFLNYAVGTLAGYLAFLAFGFFVDRLGLIDFAIDHFGYLWKGEQAEKDNPRATTQGENTGETVN